MASLWGTPARPAVRVIVWVRAAAGDLPEVARRTVALRSWVGGVCLAVVVPAGAWAQRAGAPLRGRPTASVVVAPAWHGWAEDRLTPGAWAVQSHRLAHWLWTHGLPSAALAVSLPARIGSGADLHPQAVIGRRLRLAHGFGVVVGATAEIGDDCVLLQGVTLGVRHVGQPEPPGVRVHPRLGSRVRVGAGAALLGPITVGDDVQIGANSVVLANVPPGATAVGAPARLVRGAAVEWGADGTPQGPAALVRGEADGPTTGPAPRGAAGRPRPSCAMLGAALPPPAGMEVPRLPLLDEILAHNARFVADRTRPLTKQPSRQVAILTCMDTRLVEFLEPAMGIRRGDAMVIKNAGATLLDAGGGVVRSLVVAVFALGCEEICVIGHRDCGMAQLDEAVLRGRMLARGVPAAALEALRPSLREWLGGFHDPEGNVHRVVRALRDNPLIPRDVPVHGLIFDPVAGRLELLASGYDAR